MIEKECIPDFFLEVLLILYIVYQTNQ